MSISDIIGFVVFCIILAVIGIAIFTKSDESSGSGNGSCLFIIIVIIIAFIFGILVKCTA